MAAELKTSYTSAQTLYAILLSAEGQAWNGASLEPIQDANWPAYAIPLVEQGTASGIYVGDFPPGIIASGTYTAVVHHQQDAAPAVGDPAVAAGEVRWSGSEELGPADSYWAELRYLRTPSQDKYLVQWFRNGRPVVAPVAAAAITVTRASGSPVISGKALAKVGATGALRYETSSERLAAGENAVVEVTATIDGAVRSFRTIVGRSA